MRLHCAVVLCVLFGCGEAPPRTPQDAADTVQAGRAQNGTSENAGLRTAPECMLVEEGYGPSGTASVTAEIVVSGLEVPWGIAFLPDGDMLVTERPGRIRLVENGTLIDESVATVEATAGGEGGLLGIAAHPDFESNRNFYIYYTADSPEGLINRVERWRLADDARSASAEQVVLGDIPAARYHNGGRLRFGPDGMLYVGTGDATRGANAQDRSSLAGKLLRITPDGGVPDDNPFPGSPVYIMGIRNTQGFDWPDASITWLVDHGPTGENGWQGHDEVNVASAGDNLGWPEIYSCQDQEAMLPPILTWDTAVPPGGAAIYRGDAIPGWNGDLIVGTLGSEHLHRVVIEDGVETHDVYLQGDQPQGYGRLREVIMGPDGELYVTTSNCDGRGTCPPDLDKILRITG